MAELTCASTTKEGAQNMADSRSRRQGWSSLKQSVADGGTKSVIIIIGSERRKAFLRLRVATWRAARF